MTPVTASASPLTPGELPHSRDLLCLLPSLRGPSCLCGTLTRSPPTPYSFLSLGKGGLLAHIGQFGLEYRATLSGHLTGLWAACGPRWLGHMGPRHKKPFWWRVQRGLWIQQALDGSRAVVGLCSILSPMLWTHPGMKWEPRNTLQKTAVHYFGTQEEILSNA